MGKQIANSIGNFSNMARFSFVVLCVVGFVARNSMVEGRPQASKNSIAGPLDIFRDDLTLLNLTDAELAEFFANEEAVREYAKCIDRGLKACRSSVGARRLLKQIQSLGAGGKCDRCTPEQQKRVNELVFNFMMSFRMKYPAIFQALLPKIIRFVV